MEGERSVGWPYFLSGELYGAGLRVMTAEWIIISLSLSLSLSLGLLLRLFPLPSPVVLLYPARKLTPAESFFPAKTCKVERRNSTRERASEREVGTSRKTARENSALSSRLLPGNVVTNTVPSLPVPVYERPGG